jgi:hypothetical protein
MAAALMVDHAAKIISLTISALLALQGWRGTVRFTVHIDADANSVRVVPEVLPDG